MSRRPQRRQRARRRRSRRGHRRRGGRLRRLVGGDRPYFAAVFALLVLLALMAVGPLQNLVAATDRVAGLEHSRDELTVAVTDLEERRDRLQDLEEIELLAREELGLVRPGEIPFVVVTPDDETEPIPLGHQPAVPAKPWYRRLLDAVLEFL